MKHYEKARQVIGYKFARGTDVCELEFPDHRELSQNVKERVCSLFNEGWKLVEIRDLNDENYAVFTEVQPELGEPLLDQETHWIAYEQARKHLQEYEKAVILSRKLPE